LVRAREAQLGVEFNDFLEVKSGAAELRIVGLAAEDFPARGRRTSSKRSTFPR
jgi:hypothetical protein